jgi:tetratricopeptide (TPR) repeat protein
MPVLLFALLALAPLAAPPPPKNTTSPEFKALAAQAESAHKQNRLDDALGLYEKALKLKPDWDEGWWQIGTIAYDKDRFSDCAQAFRNLAKLKPNSGAAWTMTGLCEYGIQDYPAALRSLSRADRLGFEGNKELARAGRTDLAMLYTKSGSYERAIMTITILCRSSPVTPELTAIAGIAVLRKTWLLKEVPESERPLVMTVGAALVAAAAEDPKIAVEKFEAALRAYPDNADVHYRFGAYLLKGAPDRGLAEIKKALELDPKHLPALVTLAIVSIELGDIPAAQDYGHRAVKLDPANFASHLALGRAYAAGDKAIDAVRELKLAVKLAPDSPDAHYSLANAYAGAGMKEDATRERAESERLKKLIDSPVGKQ